MTILTMLLTPPPPAPLTANPAGPAGQAAAISQAAASGAASAAMSQSLNGVNQASSAVQPGAQAAAAPAQSMASMPMQMMSQLGQLPQMAAQPLQMLGQFPQMLGQMPQMAMGMLGPLTQGMGGVASAAQASTRSAVRPDDARRDDRCRCPRWRRWRRRGRHRLRSRRDVQLHPAHRQLQRAGRAQAADRVDAGGGVPEVAASAGPATGGGTGGLYGAPAQRAPRATWDATNAAGTAPPRAGPCS